MAVKNIEGMTTQQLIVDVQNGGKFVVFYYAISIVVMSFRRGSSIYYIPAGTSAIKFGWKYMLLSSILGWWGIPWGPIYTIQSIFTGFAGKDVTAEIMSQIQRGNATSSVQYDQKF